MQIDRPPRLTADPAIHPLSSIAGAQALEPAESRLKACRACGEVQSLPAPKVGHDRKCARCGETMGSGRVHLETALPILVAGLIAFIVVLSMPLLRIELQGQHADAGLITGVTGFLHYGNAPMALFAFVCVVFAPLGRLVCRGRPRTAQSAECDAREAAARKLATELSAQVSVLAF